MTFLEAAEEVLRRERKALHYKELVDRAMRWSLLTFVGRTPEVTMQAQLTTAIKKAPGMPFVRVKPGVFGLLRYPEAPAEVPPDPAREPQGGRGAAEPMGEAMEPNDDVSDKDASPDPGPQAGPAGDEAEPGDDEGPDEAATVAGQGAAEPGFPAGGTGRRRRRRRRRRGGGELASAAPFGSPGESDGHGEEGAGDELTGAEAIPEPGTEGAETLPAPGETGEAAPSAEGPAAGNRRIMAPIDAAIEVLRSQPPGRGIHVRQIADAAVRRRLVHGEPNEAWRVLRAALAAEPRERLRQGLRPRVRAAGSGLYALARRPSDMDLDRAEDVFGEARQALRERTLGSLERRLAELPPPAFEAMARVLLQKEGFGPATFVKRVETTVYLEALRGRGTHPSRCLVALRPGAAAAGRRAVGELRAGIRARQQDEGVLLAAARLGEDAIAEWKEAGPPVEVIDGAALAEACARHALGVVQASVSVELLDTEFFADLAER